MVDTDAAYSYAPDVVERVRRLRAERCSNDGKDGGKRSCSSSSQRRWM
ncbi:MAG: hypothetical protein L0G69_05680 [Brevibacterium sp.]|nr:hypothetical protein [Brevibacterium sp.]